MPKRILARDLLRAQPGASDRAAEQHRAERERCRQSFRYFLNYWHFRDRETGDVRTLSELWPGQELFADLMLQERWILALKAGKLGFTELECAFDAWVALFRQANTRVHLFSRDAVAAMELLEIVRFGLDRLPSWLGLPVLRDEPGGDTARSVKLGAGRDDVRRIVAYASGQYVSIDQSATHCHVDELAHMAFSKETWSAIQTTIAPNGTCHIVTRGSGDTNCVAELWAAAESGSSRLYPFFMPWTARPGRDPAWREAQAGSLVPQALLHFAPETPDDALAGEETAIFIPLEVWDRCKDESLAPIGPGDRTPLVLGVDAAVTHDMFAVVAVSRHPLRHDEAAIRACKAWAPRDFGGRIDFDFVERWIRSLCQHSCPQGHPRSKPLPDCRDCAAANFCVPPHNVVQIAYDPFQLEEMMQRLKHEGIAWCREFNQQSDRLLADAMLARLAYRGAIAHNGDRQLREHIGNARARLQKDEDSKLRIVKKAPERKIDLAVAASMAVSEVLRLNL